MVSATDPLRQYSRFSRPIEQSTPSRNVKSLVKEKSIILYKLQIQYPVQGSLSLAPYPQFDKSIVYHTVNSSHITHLCLFRSTKHFLPLKFSRYNFVYISYDSEAPIPNY
jgi:hypothetical protein